MDHRHSRVDPVTYLLSLSNTSPGSLGESQWETFPAAVPSATKKVEAWTEIIKSLLFTSRPARTGATVLENMQR